MPIFQNILVTLPVSAHHKRLLEAASPSSAFTYLSNEALNPGMLGSFDAIIGSIPLKLLPYAGGLCWLQLDGSGAEGYRDKGALPESVILTCATGAYGQSVAEHAFAMLWTLMRRLHQYRDNQNRRAWRDQGPVQTLLDATVLVVGLGDIGATFARMVHAMGAIVIGIDRSERARAFISRQYTLDALDALLPAADVVMLCVPDTEKTRGLIGARQLDLMKRSAILLNCGRGSAILTDALCDAVSEGRIYAAGLDVTDPEPLPEGHRLWGITNILLSPHVAGGYHLPQTLDRIVQIAASNLSLLSNDEKPISLVDRALGFCVK